VEERADGDRPNDAQEARDQSTKRPRAVPDVVDVLGVLRVVANG
jgi:hypothetical protein